jgi:hypothetical protein
MEHPEARKQLLSGLAVKGFGCEQLLEMEKIIHAEKRDLFDVLAYVAYALAPLNREERAARAQLAISTQFSSKVQAFLDFVLAHYVSQGVEELDQEKLGPLLRLKYHSITDALADLGPAEELSQVFAGFQQYLPAATSGQDIGPKFPNRETNPISPKNPTRNLTPHDNLEAVARRQLYADTGQGALSDFR